MANDKSSSKFDKAVDRARGNTEVVDAAAPDAIAPGVLAMISDMTTESMSAITSDPTMEFAPQLVSLKEGQMIAGLLEGNGPEAEFTHVDKATGKVTHTIAQTWIVKDPKGGQRASILSTAQLDRKLPPFIGGLVKIVRGPDIQTNNGYRVTDYLVAGPKIEGVTRTWATKPVLDAAPAQPMLAESAAGNSVNQAS